MKNIKNLKVDLSGQVGENAIWDGPLSKEGFPMGKGSSSGISGMEVSKYPCNHTPETPITQKAKAYRNELVRYKAICYECWGIRSDNTNSIGNAFEDIFINNNNRLYNI